MVKPRFSNIEIVTPTSSPLSPHMPAYGGRAMLSSTDRVLIDNGGGGLRGLDIYLSLFVNPVVFKSWDKVMCEVCSRELTVTPKDNSAEAVRVADFVREQLLSIGTSPSKSALLPANGGVDELTRALGTAYITGISPVELVWGRDTAGKRVIQYFKPRDPRLFRMEYDAALGVTRPRVLTRDNMIKGVPIPAHKFVFHRYWAVPSDDEYGCGIGRNLFYPVEWQKQLMSYWLMLVDKTVMPSTVGSIAPGTKFDDTQYNDFVESVRNFGQDSALVLRPGYSIEVKDLKATNVDALEKLLTRLDAYIEGIVVGESGTGKGGAGSQAKDQVSDGIRLMNAKALSDAISETMNTTLVKWLAWANFGRGCPLPTVWRNFDEDIAPVPATIAEITNIADFVDILGKLNAAGITLDKAYIEQRLGAPLKKAPAAVQLTSKPADTKSALSAPASLLKPERTGTALFDYVPMPAELLGV